MNVRACATNEDSQLNDRDVISLTIIDFITAFDIVYLRFLECSPGWFTPYNLTLFFVLLIYYNNNVQQRNYYHSWSVQNIFKLLAARLK